MSNLPVGYTNISGGGSGGVGTSSTYLAGSSPFSNFVFSSTTTSTNLIPLTNNASYSGLSAGSSNQVTLTPLVIPNTLTIDRLSIAAITTSSEQARIVIYLPNANTKLPVSLLLATEALNMTATGFSTSTVSTTLQPGAYWIGLHTQGFASQYVGGGTLFNNNFLGFTGASLASVPSNGIRAYVTGATFASGAPTTLGVPTMQYGQSTPVIFCRFVSSP